MKRFERSLLLCIALILVLSSGGSYLAFQSSKAGGSSRDVDRMSIALVNEDDGAQFKGQMYDFGAEFIKNIEKDEGQDWYVVSRGVAESGMREDKYSMMILIPNDFTEKALSIDSKTPEKVSLNYKVNAKGNSSAKARADKTASAVLGDFNRRIIDVYFASVIGNLHAAQDRIGTMINKEQAYTALFQNEINRPLSSYTSQFNLLKEGTGGTKSGFVSLKEILDEFGDSLASGSRSNETFYSQMQNLRKMKETNGLDGQAFSSSLEQFARDMDSAEVMERLDALVSANTAMKEQFLQKNSAGKTIPGETAALQAYLDATKKRFGKIDEDLAEQLSADMQKSIAAKLRNEIKMTSGQEQDVYLSQIFSSVDQSAAAQLRRQIDKLPSLKTEEAEALGFGKAAAVQLNNVMAVTRKYSREFQYTPANPAAGMPLSNQIREIKADLVKNGITIADTAVLPANKRTGQELTLSLPQEYEVRQVRITLPHTEERDYTLPYKLGGKIFLPASVEGRFTIRVHAALKEEAVTDVFEPLAWSWQLHQKNSEDADEPEPPEEPPADPGPPKEEPEPDKTVSVRKMSAEGRAAAVQQTAQNETENPPGEGEPAPGEGEDPPGEGEPAPGEGEDPPGEGEPAPGEGEDPPGEGEPAPGKGEDPGEGEPAPGEGEDPPGEGEPAPGEGGTPPGEGEPDPGEGTKPPFNPFPIMIKNNYISHQVMSPLVSDTVSRLINAASSTVSEYQKLLMLYEVYFGLDMESPDLNQALENNSLKDLAAPRSLYYMFHKQDMADVLSGYVAEQITEEVRRQTEELKANVNEYMNLVNEADGNSRQLAELIRSTAEQAEALNGSVEEILKRVTAWRNANMELQEAQSALLLKGEDEHTAVAELEGGFTSILSESQSLAEQSKGNLEAADQVYSTIDGIEDRADFINSSGASIVKEAGELSENLAEKLATDEDFAANFAAVLANSRVGKRQNENLLSFLSNPVETKNAGIMVTDETEIPYFVVLICFIAALFTAYAISQLERRPVQGDAFEGERPLAARNMRITVITAGIGLAEGLLVGVLTGYFLEADGRTLAVWTALLTLIMLALLMIATYLLRQLKMIGMFILLGVLSMYLLLTEAAGVTFDKQSVSYRIREYSPLQYIEELLNKFLIGSPGQVLIVIILAAAAAAGLAGQLLVMNRSRTAGNGVPENEEPGI